LGKRKVDELSTQKGERVRRTGSKKKEWVDGLAERGERGKEKKPVNLKRY